jgi:hypothetical protein
VFEFTFSTPERIARQTFAMFSTLHYQVSQLKSTGQLAPFDYEAVDRTSHKHIDLACFPSAVE